jgi:hypothetical protein
MGLNDAKKALPVAAAAPFALAPAKSLRRRPGMMKKMLSFNRDYIDWRCPNTVCRTSYSDNAYMRPTKKRPERFTGKLTRMTDFIFSRVDVPYL